MVVSSRFLWLAAFALAGTITFSSVRAETLYVDFYYGSSNDLVPTGTIEKYDVATGANLGSISTGLNDLCGMAFDTAGNLYVAEQDNSTIQKITPQGTVSTFASGGGLNQPFGLAMGSNGNLYVANSGNGTISVITPQGVISTFASLGSSSAPFGLAFDSAGNLLVADHGGNSLIGTIDKITPGGTISTFATSNYGSPYQNIAIDAAGNIFVNMDGGEVDKITPSGSISPFLVPPGSGVTLVGGILFDPEGNLLGHSAKQIINVTPGGQTSTFVNTPNTAFYEAIAPVPEPGTLTLSLASVAFFVARRRGRANQTTI